MTYKALHRKLEIPLKTWGKLRC